MIRSIMNFLKLNAILFNKGKKVFDNDIHKLSKTTFLIFLETKHNTINSRK